ncbi:hypothetical protein B0T24DRAFT_633994 [Lasiosphaeria ovina]|uniref:Secreted protein n=1 Tax=Lasiosphaeria ovina TaxID=92902 RepID=A0AAE0JYW5_9PEZI|nr:hypothetical protein B0T24DRAFT_633994 [Lasiosphaeria ovina]
MGLSSLARLLLFSWSWLCRREDGIRSGHLLLPHPWQTSMAKSRRGQKKQEKTENKEVPRRIWARNTKKDSYMMWEAMFGNDGTGTRRQIKASRSIFSLSPHAGFPYLLTIYLLLFPPQVPTTTSNQPRVWGDLFQGLDLSGYGWEVRQASMANPSPDLF